jgi:hypothetical protein
MKDFLSRFNEMVDGLKAHPNVQVISYHVFDPATEKEIKEVEEFLGRELEQGIKEFYRQCNGIQLRWIRKDSEYFKPREFGTFIPGPFTYEDVLDDSMALDGCVNILPIKEVFLTNLIERYGRNPFAKDDTIYLIDGISATYREFVSKIWVFDLFNQEWDAAICNWKGVDFFVRGFDGQRIFQKSKAMRANAYFELLIRSHGEINARLNFFDGARMVSFLSPIELDDIESFTVKL